MAPLAKLVSRKTIREQLSGIVLISVSEHGLQPPAEMAERLMAYTEVSKPRVFWGHTFVALQGRGCSTEHPSQGAIVNAHDPQDV